MTVEGNCRIGRIAHALVTAAGHHHVDTADQTREVLVALQGVELIDHHDLVHAQSLQRVDCALQVSGHLLQVACRAVRIILRHCAVRGRLAEQLPGRRTDEANLLTVDGLDRIRSDLGLDRGHFRACDGTTGAAERGVSATAQRAIVREVKIRCDQRELSTRPVAHRAGVGGEHSARQYWRTKVKLVITQGRNCGAEQVHDRDIRLSKRRRSRVGGRGEGAGVQQAVESRVRTRHQPRSRDEGVALAHHDGVRVVVVELVNHRAHDRGRLNT